MIPGTRSKILEKFADSSFSDDELIEFQSILRNDPMLAEDIKLFEEVDDALRERDILLLRSQLKNIINKTAITPENGHPADADAYFGLSEEVFNAVNLEAQSEGMEFGNYLQKLHLKNHAVASKEVVHDLFSATEGIAEEDSQRLSPDDELLFEDVVDAVTEKDIIDLRANLQSIAEGISKHGFKFEEIEDFVSGELDKENETLIREEAKINAALTSEIELHSEINSAIEEQDVMKLRAGLKELMQKEYSHSRSMEEIDGYLRDELDEQAVENFEDELLANTGLAADVAFHKELDKAVSEVDVMALRANLQHISKAERNRSSEKLGVGPPKRKKLLWYAAASTILFVIGFSTLMRNKNHTYQQLYTSYYQPYKIGANVSRSVSESPNELSTALSYMDRGNYPAALNVLKSTPTNEQDGFSIKFYSGVAYQELGEYKNAISSFNDVVQQGDNLLVEQAEWYIGLCYLRIEEREKARAQFRSIVSKNGFYSKQSSKILKQLE